MGWQGLGPPQHAANPRQQLAWLEGFDEIVVRPHFQADHAVEGFALGREHEHRHIGPGAQIPAQAQAIFSGKHEVEDDQVDAAL